MEKSVRMILIQGVYWDENSFTVYVEVDGEYTTELGTFTSIEYCIEEYERFVFNLYFHPE